jgi:hypothetical protein
MECVLCDAEGHVRACTLAGGVALTVMCAAHEVACIVAVADNDFSALVEQVTALTSGESEDPETAAKVLAVTRLWALSQSDHELLTELMETLLAMPSESDSADKEWAAIETIRRKLND